MTEPQSIEATRPNHSTEAYFITAPETRESVFSTAEVAHEIGRAKLFKDAELYHYADRLPEKDDPKQLVEASASQSFGEPRDPTPKSLCPRGRPWPPLSELARLPERRYPQGGRKAPMRLIKLSLLCLF